MGESEYRTLVNEYRTISRGNCKSINNDIAGKIKSEARGLEDIVAAVAKELNATIKGIGGLKSVSQGLHDYIIQ